MDKLKKRLQEISDRGLLKREATVGAVNAEARTVELSFSSETEYGRWFGIEILGHDATNVRMGRLLDGAPLLWNHDRDDMRGVIESAAIDSDRIGRALVRLSRSPAGEQLMQDIIDGIVTKVSVGYMVHGMKLIEERSDTDVYLVTDWEPFEISMVSIPADNTVGVGRSMENPPQEANPANADTSLKQVLPISIKDTRIMTPEEIAAQEKAKREREEQLRSAGTEAERARVRAINDLGEKFGHTDMARTFAHDGKTVEEFRDALLEAQNKREQQPINQQAKSADIGLTDKEARQFSLMKVVRALSEPTDRRAQEAAVFEFEASATAQKRSGKASERFMLPSDVLTRALNSGTNGASNADTGGFSIANTLMTQSFIEILRNRCVLLQRGSAMGGLVGNIDIPRQTAAATGYWLGEDEDATESNLGLGQISMSPKTVAAYSEITRKLAQQSSMDVEALVRADLAKALALTIDKAGFYGTGSDHQPLGLANQTGIHAQPFATAGKPTFQELIAMETQIALDNADVKSMAYIGNATLRGYLKGVLKFPGAAGESTIWESGGTVNGYATDITNQVNAGDLFFGNWADLLIGMWGGMELMVDPYSGSKKGRLRIVVFQDVDIALRRVESFTLGR